MTTLVLFSGRRIAGTCLVDQLIRLMNSGEHVAVLATGGSDRLMTGDLLESLHEQGARFYVVDECSQRQGEKTENKPGFVVHLGYGDAVRLIEECQRVLSWTY